MKKLKKGLSLLLVLAMVFSLATTAFAGWDVSNYKDADKITQTEAVAVLTGLGVIEGDETTGLFDPTGDYTREAAAKVLTYMLVGPTAASKLTASSDPFADVPAGKWSAGSIAYLTNEGIVEGYGDNNFGPGDKLTRAAWLKMLLCAMGYDADENGMGDDPNWDVKAEALAVKSGLISGEDLGLDWNRETAVYYAFKAIQKNKNLADSKDTTKPFLVTVTHEALNEETNKTEDKTDKVTTKADAFGRPSFYYSKSTEKKAYATGTEDAVLTYNNAETKVAAITKALGEKAVDVNYTYYVDGKDETDSLSTAVGNLGATVEVYATATEHSYIIVQVNTYAAKLAKGDITAANEKTETAAYITIDKMDYETDEFEADDVVLYTKATADEGTSYTIQSVVKAESIQGAITAKYTGTPEYIRVDGEKMNIAKNVLSGFTVAGASVAETEVVVYTDTYGNVVGTGAISEASAAATYAYVVDRVATAADTKGGELFTDATTTAAVAQAKVVDLATGETKVVNETLKYDEKTKVYTYAGTKPNAGASDAEVQNLTQDNKWGAEKSAITVAGEGAIMQYTVADDGSYKLTAVADSETVVTKNSITVDTNVASVTNVSGAVATSATKLTIVTITNKNSKFDSASVSTVTGIANFPKAKDLTGAVVTTKDGKITEIVALDVLTETTAVNYAVYTGVGETTKVNGEDKTMYNFVVDGETVSYAVTIGSTSVGDVVSLDVAANGVDATISSLETVKVDAADVTVVDDTYVKTSAVYYFADGYKVVDATGTPKTYAATTIKDGDNITIYTDKSGEGAKAAFVIVNSHKDA